MNSPQTLTKQDKIDGLMECIADSKFELTEAIEAYGPRSPWVEAIRETIRMATRQLAALEPNWSSVEGGAMVGCEWDGAK